MEELVSKANNNTGVSKNKKRTNKRLAKLMGHYNLKNQKHTIGLSNNELFS